MDITPMEFSRYSDNPKKQKEYEEWLVKYKNKKKERRGKC